jgi:SagB-type dehydrogenase family enzyme
MSRSESNKESDMKQTIIELPDPQLKGNVSLEETLLRRRAVRRYRGEPLLLSQLSQILWSAQGITGTGIYRYDPKSHSLSLHTSGDLRPDLARATLNQEFVMDVPVDIVICAIYHRTSYRYGKRGERYIHMEVGHVGENIHLQAVALGLSTVEVGAFNDEEVTKVLGVEEQIKPLYIMPVGESM